jgi:uncharacterized protein with ATP-grasp and redox domains
MGRRLKIVFHVEDGDTKEIVIDKQQVVMDVDDESIAGAELVPELTRQIEELLTAGKNVEYIQKVCDKARAAQRVADITDVAGTVVSRFVRLKLFDYFAARLLERV